MKAVVIIPTYNESQNIGPLIEALSQQFCRLAHDMHILVVDDDSPDGTAETVRSKQRAYPFVHLIGGTRAGLGAAYIRGMRHALEHLQADAVFEMDADFSHKPEDLPRLMAALENGADLVIGSRYVEGGRIPDHWGIRRKLISRVGNLVARHVAGLRRIRDCTAGFRAMRRTWMDRVDWSALKVQGYAFQVALLSEAVQQKAVVKEIPVEFVDRTQGESKLRLADMVEFFVNAWLIRFRNSHTFIKFAAVGLLGVGVNLAAFTLLLALGIHKYLASPLAVEISILSNFWLNNFWTFRGRETGSSMSIKGLKFNVVSLAALIVSTLTFLALSALFPQTKPQIHQLVSVVPASILNYLLNSAWTFRERSR